MTKLLYYDDPELLEFDARVEEVTTHRGKPALVLSQTAFYPEGGGQPADHGTIGGLAVVDVSKSDGVVYHLVDRDPDAGVKGETVRCAVDAVRRRDFMQQHTGQHILSAALLSVGNHNTVSVHQGDEYTTIEVSSDSVTDEELARVQQMANEAIEADLPVRTVFVDESEVGNYPLRRPPKVSGTIRLVQVGELDCVACGGVHVTRTGKIRLVQALAVESIRGNTRIAWRIGDRALRDYDDKNRIVREIGAHLSAQPSELAERVAARSEQMRFLEMELKRLWSRVYAGEAASLLSAAQADGSGGEGATTVVTATYDDEPRDFLRGVMEALVTNTGVAACLVNVTEGSVQWSIGAGEGAELEWARMKELLPLIDGKGGGKPPIWQGIGGAGDGVGEFLERFRALCP